LIPASWVKALFDTFHKLWSIFYGKEYLLTLFVAPAIQICYGTVCGGSGEVKLDDMTTKK